MLNAERRSAFGSILLVAAVSALAVILQYHPTVHYGFYYDDYHFVRPFSREELRHAFGGSWDPDAIETPYFRPLTTCLFAARFLIFGFNAVGYHVLSMTLFVVGAALFGALVTRVTMSPLMGAAGAVLLAVHPAFPYSAVAWITNQMHLAQMLVTLSAFLWWFFVRRRSAVWWLPFIALQAAALMIKEDGVMLFAAVVALHLLLKHLREPDLPRVPLTIAVVTIATLAALLTYRQSVLPLSTRLHAVNAERAWQNLSGALNGVYRLVPAKRPHQAVASWLVTLLPLLPVVRWTRISPTARFLIASGLILGALFALPFVYIVKAEQLYLVPVGATLLLVGSLVGLLDLTPPRREAQAAVAVAGGLSLAAMSLVTTNIAADFAPFSPMVQHADTIVVDWAAVPVEIRDYLRQKAGASVENFDSNPATAVDVISCGLHDWERDRDGQRSRWMSRPVVDLYVRKTATRVDIPLRHELGAFRQTTTASITADDRELDRIAFADDRWRVSSLALPRFRGTPLSEMHHVQIRIPRTWVPSAVAPGSTDTRRLGLHVGEVTVR